MPAVAVFCPACRMIKSVESFVNPRTRALSTTCYECQRQQNHCISHFAALTPRSINHAQKSEFKRYIASSFTSDEDIQDSRCECSPTICLENGQALSTRNEDHILAKLVYHRCFSTVAHPYVSLLETK